MMKTIHKPRVDQWVDRAKNHPLVAVIIFLALTVFAIAKLADSVKTITDAWNRFSKPTSPASSSSVVQSSSGGQSPNINSSGGGPVTVEIKPAPSQHPANPPDKKK
ncbi:MAG: hypothetical protein ABSC47_02760 [Terracidiphilus sp.]|jgi:hypothetical protein